MIRLSNRCATWAVGLALITAAPSPSHSSSVSVVASSDSVAAAETEWTVVRVDPTTYAETELGVIAFANKPPFVARFVSGDATLQTIVSEHNALDHVMSTGWKGPGSKILRSEDQYFRIMRGNWLGKQKGVVLQARVKSAAKPRRFRAYYVSNGKNDELGTVVLKPSQYLQIVESKPGEAEHLHKILREVNDHDSFSVDIPPPSGAGRGSYGRGVNRGTPLFFTLLRDKLLHREKLVLCDEQRSRPATMHHLELTGGGLAQIPWLQVDIDKSMIAATTPPKGEILHYSDDKARLAFILERYDGAKNTAAVLSDLVSKRHGQSPGFKARLAVPVEVAGRELLTVAFRTGSGATITDHAVIMWPQGYYTAQSDVTMEKGFLIHLSGPGKGDAPDAAALLKQEVLARIIDSLYLDPEWSS